MINVLAVYDYKAYLEHFFYLKDKAMFSSESDLSSIRAQPIYKFSYESKFKGMSLSSFINQIFSIDVLTNS